MSRKQRTLESRQKTTVSVSPRAAVEVSLATKQKCETKAMTVVLSLIETQVSEDYLEGVGKFIRRNHYQDVTEERALEKQCGYPLCSNNLQRIPAQKYHISAKSNKVYDISERKNFCCNQCFKCSKYLEEQLLTSPLWLEDDDETANQPLKLLSSDSNNQGVVGIEVEFGKLTLKPEAEELSKLDTIGPGAGKPCHIAATETVLAAAYNKEVKDILLPILKESEGPIPELPPSRISIDTNSKDTKTPVSDESLESVILSHTNSTPSSNNNVRVQECKVQICSGERRGKSVNNPFDVVEKRLTDWVTVNTAIFILGDQMFQELLKDSEHQSGIVHNADSILMFRQHYVNLCHKLDLEETRDKKADESLIGNEDSDDEKVPTKHLPTLEELQRTESQLKVLAFYKGCMEPPADAHEEEIKVVKEVQFKRRKSRLSPQCKVANTKKDSSESVERLSFPLLDSLSQAALRRRIVLDRLNNACSELLDVLGLTRPDVANGLRKLVQTLRLDAQNIILKPAEWPFVVIIFLKLLAIRDIKLQQALDRETSVLFLETLLKGLNKPVTCVQLLIDNLLDVNMLLNKGPYIS